VSGIIHLPCRREVIKAAKAHHPVPVLLWNYSLPDFIRDVEVELVGPMAHLTCLLAPTSHFKLTHYR